ncbi:MAG: ABC transporter ATP-binding protein [Mobilitalea sp.]
MEKLITFFKDWKNQTSHFSWIMLYAKPFIPQILIVMFLGLLTTLSSVVLAVISKNIIDAATGGGMILWAIAVYVGIVLINQVIKVISDLMSVMLNEKYSFGIRKQLYEKIINSHWMDVQKYHTGDIVTRLTSDAGIIADGVVVTIPMIIQLFIELLITFCTLFYYEPRLALFALLLAPMAGVVSMILGRKLKPLQVKVQESESSYRSYLQESLSNLLIVKAFANEQHAVDRLAKLREERFYWVYKKNKLSILSSMILSLTFQFGYIGAFTLGSFQLAKSAITYGTMSIFLTLVNRIQAPIIALAQTIPKLVSILASAGRIRELQDIPFEEKAEYNIDSEQIGVQVDHLGFGYSEDTIFEDTSFTIYPGEFVAIIGASGIGKTTLIRLIMSFMSNNKGSIQFWNNKGDTEMANAGSREFLAYVPQGNTLFSGTIRENIYMGKLDATDEEIYEALKQSSSYSFVSELPYGIDTVIGEKGHGLSEGQAQRIAIARALIKKAPFLILDEATSALDEKTEIYVLQEIQKITPRPTCLLITHRKSVLQYCDRELRIEEKKVQECNLK